MSVVVRDGASYEGVSFAEIEDETRVEHLVEQVIGVRDPDARLGVIRDLVFDGVDAPHYRPPASNWTWYAQFRPTHPVAGASVAVFEGADEEHAVDGLTLRNVAIGGERVVDIASATRAGLTIRVPLRNIRFE